MTGRLTRDHVIWTYRVLLDREPAPDEVLRALNEYGSIQALRRAIVSSEEYERQNPDLLPPGEHAAVIHELQPGLRLFVDLADHPIGPAIVRSCYERNELDFVRQTVRPGQHVIDAGAHVGFFTMHLAALVGDHGSVQSFEPLDENAGWLERSVRENGLERRVHLERAALGAAAGLAVLVCPAGSRSHATGAAFLQARGDSRVPHGCELRLVHVVALDDRVRFRPVAFIKLDVKGAEPLALRGGARLLREDRPVVLSDVHPALLERVSRTQPRDFIAEMARAGYRCHLLGAGLAGAVIEDVPGPGAAQVVFVPEGRSA
jgi:FkbM family methyltransferase